MPPAARGSSAASAAALPRGLLLTLLWLEAAAGKDLGGGWEEKTNDEGKVVQQLKIEAPAFTEEDQYGYVMPDRYRCDSCRAVMFHLDQELRKKQPKSRRLKQWEFTDVFDDVCRGSFEGYGIRLVNGENTLSGPGLKQAEELAPGSGAIQMGGESWGKRLGEICRKIVYEKLGEEEVYDRFWAHFSGEASSGLGQELCATELRECVVGPATPPKPKAKEKEKEKEKKPKPRKPKASSAKAEAARSTSRQKAADAAPAKKAGAAAVSDDLAASGARIGVEAFLRDLAVRHGLTPEEYLAARTVGEWERLSVAIASRLFNTLSTSGGSGSCSADGR